jgi:hypothetical protein
MPWKNAGKKLPDASAYSPYPHPFDTDGKNSSSWADPANWTSFDHARQIHAQDSEIAGITFVLQDDDEPYADFTDELTLIDGDDVINLEKKSIHPTWKDLIEKANSYTDISFSHTGSHIMVWGSIPDGFRDVQGPLPEHSDFPGASIEVYDGKRHCAMTGIHIAETPAEINEAQRLIDRLSRKYGKQVKQQNDVENHEPRKTRTDIQDLESTDDIRDVYDAIAHTTPSDIRLQSDVTNERSGDDKDLDPSWSKSESGTRLGQVGDGWIYRKGNIGMDALKVVALEERIITDEHDYPSGSAFWDAVEALRVRGATIPEFDGNRQSQETVLLPPNTPKAIAWDWGPDTEPLLSQQEVYDRTWNGIDAAINTGSHTLIDTPMRGGKNYNSVGVAAETDSQALILMPNGHGDEEREGQYDEQQRVCEKHGLEEKDVVVLPSVWDRCPSFNGEFETRETEQAKHAYNNQGATAKDCHINLDLPCQQGGRQCPWKREWANLDDDAQIYLGHYYHSQVYQARAGRVMIMDELPNDSFEIVIENQEEKISYYLKGCDWIPADSYTELMNLYHPDLHLDMRLRDFPNRLHKSPFQNERGHALVEYLIYTIVMSERVGDYNRVEIPDFGVGLLGRDDNKVRLLHQPETEGSRAVIGLDGTPGHVVREDENRPRMWELLFPRMRAANLFTDRERRDYVENNLGQHVVRTSDATHPFNPNDELVESRIDRNRIGGLLTEADRQQNRRNAVITTLTAEEHLSDLLAKRNTNHYGNIRGSAQFQKEESGIVLGCNSRSDDDVKKWGAYMGEAVEADRSNGAVEYSGVGDTLHKLFTHGETAQAGMRFGQEDFIEPTVYVDTNTLPHWYPVHEVALTAKTWTNGQREVIDAIRGKERLTTSELSDEVDLTNRQVLNVLRMLEKQDVIRSEDKDGRSLWWSDVEVESIEHGNFEIGKSRVIDTIILNFPIPDDLDGRNELQPSSESVSEQTGADPPPKASD